jgi:tRNA pseudouridine38-40 synthase
MEAAATQFLGEHNFSNLARVGDKNPWRKILEIRIGNEGRFVYLEVKAESFLWHQVRCMAAVLFSVGIGEQDADGIRLLLNEAVSRPIQPAPAEGLVLWDTDCGLSWVPIEKSDRSGTYCTELRRHHALMEQVCRVLRPEPREQS